MALRHDTSTADLLAALTAELNPSGLHGRFRDFERGGHPASSLPGGSPTAETPLPLWDQVDRRLNSDRARYGQCLREARSALEAAVTIQNAWLVSAPAPPPCCENPDCLNVLEEGRQSGECYRCRQWRHRNGLPFPQR